MSRPLMTVVAAQQAVLDGLRARLAVQAKQIALIARLAGVTAEVDALAKTADINNPAQPVADSPEQAPSQTSEQAVTPETNDDVRSPGQTGNSTEGVPAGSTDTAIEPGGSMAAEPYGNLVDVTAPVSGTNTGEIPLEETRIQTDVRAMDPMQPDVAFPWTISPNDSNNNPPRDGEMAGGSKHSNRSFASLHLARLRIQAGVAAGDDLMLAAAIDADQNLTSPLIEHEISILSQLGTARQAAAQPRTTMPRRAAQAARTAPSLAEPSKAPESSNSEDDALFLAL